MLSELKNVVNELNKRGLTQEAHELNDLIKNAFAFAAIPAIAYWIAGIAGTGAIVGGSLAMNEGARTILGALTDDFEMEEAGPLFKRWYEMLTETDLINGWGTFPAGDYKGKAWIRNFIWEKMRNKSPMTEEEFQDSVEKYYGESTLGAFQFGLDNEEGWVESYNAIATLWKAQDAATAQGLDWRTDKPLKKEEGVDPDKDKDTDTDSTPEETWEEAISGTPEEDIEDTWEDAIGRNVPDWATV